MVDLKVNRIFPVGNAAGWCKSVAEVEVLAKSAASFIVVGSITLLPREGNLGNTFNGDPLFTLNSLGLPNPGIENLETMSPEMVRIARGAEKPIIASIAGFTPKEFGELAWRAHRVGFDGIEVNVGCPNLADGGKRKPIISYRPDLVRSTLEHVTSRLGFHHSSRWFISVKVSPMDPDRLEEIASVVRGFPINAVVTMNTVPNCLSFRSDGRPLIDTPDNTGYAGGSGQQVFAQALGQVSQWRSQLPGNIEVWGAGGVWSGDGVRQMRLAGASVVQIGTAYFVSGANKTFGDIANQFVNMED